MKRHKSLIPLSKDHHRSLLLAQLLKKDAPEYKGLPTDSIGKYNYLMDKWESELKLHFLNEETILFPFVEGNSEDIDLLIIELITEHAELKKLIEDQVPAAKLEETLDKIGHLLERHIRKEERILFEQLQNKMLSKLELLSDKISESHTNCDI